MLQTHSGKIFGGFTQVSWSSEQQDLPDPSAFLFSWDHKEIYEQIENTHAAVRHDHCYGPFFGFGPQFRLTDNCHKNNSSIMKVDNVPTFSFGSRNRDDVTGSFNFRVEDYEVFQISSFSPEIFEGFDLDFGSSES